jgi:hypothetical protein
MIRKIILILTLLPFVGFGQQSALISHYYENITLLNPSMVGYDQNNGISLLMPI